MFTREPTKKWIGFFMASVKREKANKISDGINLMEKTSLPKTRTGFLAIFDIALTYIKIPSKKKRNSIYANVC